MKKLVPGIAATSLLVVGGAAVAAWTAGAALPAHHQVELTVATRQGPSAVWRTINDFPGQTAWRPDLSAVQQVDDVDGNPAWQEVTADGQVLTLVTVAVDPPRRLTRRIVDDGWFSGSWTLRVVPEGLGTRISLTEEGTIPNPLVRLYATEVMGLDTTGRAYLRSLADHLGDPQNQVERVEVSPAEGGSTASR